MRFPKLERRPELDALRGIFIILMVAVHLPTHLSDVLSQPFGFVSCAEGFVGLSALLVGRIYFGPIARDEAGARAKLWKRSLKIYGYHLVLLALAFTVAAQFALRTNRIAIENLLHFYLLHPVVAVAGSLLLIYCPPLLDILPMYILFLALTPLLLLAAARVGWRWILTGSAAIWLAAQFGFREIVHHWVVVLTHMPIPVQQTGSFNLLAWQAIWVAGLWLGAQSALGEFPLNRVPRWAALVAAPICTFFFLVRHGWIGPHLTQQWLGGTVDKWQLAPLRVLNIVCLFIVGWSLRRYLLRLISREPLVTFGKASLQVFCAHLVFVFAGLALLYGDRLHIHGTSAILLVLISFVVLFGVALHQKRKMEEARKPHPATAASAPAASSLSAEPEVASAFSEERPA